MDRESPSQDGSAALARAATLGWNADGAAAGLLLLAVLALALTAPTHGEFWWSDSPRHALNGAFLADLVRDRPELDHLRQWAIDYYLQYPALTILFYPPLVAAAEAVAFLAFGVSHATAVGTIMVFYAALGLGAYALGRRWMKPAEACAAALMLCAFPEVSIWGRQVMTEIPAFAFLVWSVWAFDRAQAEGRPGFLYGAVLLLLFAAYCKLTVIFILPVFGIVLIWERRLDALRDRHVWLASVAMAVGLVPLAILTLKFGQANLQSVTGVSDTYASQRGFIGWLYYLRLLPDQVGWVPLALAVAYGAVAAVGRSTTLPRRAAVLLVGWFVVGYLFFSAISLKEERHTLILLYPLAIAAVLGIKWLVRAPRLVAPAVIALAVGTLAWTLAFVPVPRVDGYAEAAHWIVDHAPPGRILFSGERDGSFIFNLRADDPSRRYTVVRADKLLLSIAIRREIGVTEKAVSPAQLAAMFSDYAMAYVVAQQDFWIDLKSMRGLQDLLESGRFEEVARIPVTANVPTKDHEIRIYRFLGALNDHPKPLAADLPAIDESFKEAPDR